MQPQRETSSGAPRRAGLAKPDQAANDDSAALLSEGGGLKKPMADADESEALLAEGGGRSSDSLAKPDQADADRRVEEASEESFPASDPPSFNRGHSGSPCADRDPEG